MERGGGKATATGGLGQLVDAGERIGEGGREGGGRARHQRWIQRDKGGVAASRSTEGSPKEGGTGGRQLDPHEGVFFTKIGAGVTGLII
jgi:hypothetical protein